MGSICTFELAGYPIEQSKSFPIPELMAFFRERDRRVFVRKVSERNPLLWGNLRGDDSEEDAFTYSVKICDFKSRLDLLGFSLEKSKMDFEQCKKDKIEHLTDLNERSTERLFEDDLVILNRASFEGFLEAFRTIQQRSLIEVTPKFTLQHDDSSLLKRIFKNNDDNLDFFPCSDIRFLIRAFAETCPDHAFATYELTEVVHAGYYDPDDAIADMATQTLIGEYPRYGKIIILTEGKTDRRILEGSLHLLYPHLADYFSFMDFETSKAEGGAGALVNTVRSFIGAGIMNRTVALFDNDTAAAEALRGLALIAIPVNIKTMRLPDIDLARDYPTLGPNGIARSNINGLACAVELYLGRDVLEADGNLVPIQWTGYSRSAGKYQGVLVNKQSVHSRFFDKLEVCKREPRRLEEFDWANLRTVFERVFSVFN